MRYFKNISGGDVFTIKEDKHLTYFLSRPEQFIEVILTERPKPRTVTRYFNVYGGCVSRGYVYRDDADDDADDDRLACQKVTFTEGEYDE